MTYESKQAKVLFPHWDPDIEVFIVGGVADADEAQTVKKVYPNVECIGFEPNTDLFSQAVDDFPGELYNLALWCETLPAITLSILGKKGRSSRITGPIPGELESVEGEIKTEEVKAIRLDAYWQQLRQRKIALWLDIEYAEMGALEGAGDLLHDVVLLNIEVTQAAENLRLFECLLEPFNLSLVETWNTTALPGRADAIFKRSKA